MTARLSIQEVASRIFKLRGWTYKSGHYKNNSSKLIWYIPSCKHTVRLSYGKATTRGCPECNRRLNQQLPTEVLEKYLTSRNGKIISRYVNNLQKIEIQCPLGNTFSKSWIQLKRGQWCPDCSPKRVGESFTRNAFEFLFKESFPTIRRYSINGERFELDGYCKTLNLAFEYNGKQHYQYIPTISRSLRAFHTLLKTDRIKKEYCIANGITLVEIPEINEWFPNLPILKKFDGKTTRENLPLIILSQIPKNIKSRLKDTLCYYDKYDLDKNKPALISLAEALTKTNRSLVDYSGLWAQSVITSVCHACGRTATTSYRNIVKQNRQCRCVTAQKHLIAPKKVNQVMRSKKLKMLEPFAGQSKRYKFQTPSGHMITEIFSSIKNSSCVGDQFAFEFQIRKEIRARRGTN